MTDPRLWETNRRRLIPLDRSRELLPWHRAHDIQDLFLYWMPVTSFPISQSQRDWLMTFFDRFKTLMSERQGLRQELFLQFKVIRPALVKPFTATELEFNPILGLSRRPGDVLPEGLECGLMVLLYFCRSQVVYSANREGLKISARVGLAGTCVLRLGLEKEKNN